MFVHTVIMVIEPHMKQGRQHKLISTIFLATSVTKKLDHNSIAWSRHMESAMVSWIGCGRIYIFRRIPWRLYAEFWTAAWRMWWRSCSMRATNFYGLRDWKRSGRSRRSWRRKRRGRDSKAPVWQNLVHNRLRKCSCLRYREQKPTVKKEKWSAAVPEISCQYSF